MIRLIILMLIFSILFIDPYFLQNSLADHLLEKSKDESLSFHKNWRMKVARENFKNEIVRKATSPKVLKDNAKLNSRLREIINNSDLLSVLYFNGKEIEVNEISSKKMKDTDLMYSHSMSKSYIGYLLGHAVCDGYIKSLDDPIDKYLNETKGTVYEGVSLRNMVNMSAGDGSYFDEKGYKSNLNVKAGKVINLKSYAIPLMRRDLTIKELLKKTEKKYQTEQTFEYSNIVPDIVGNALDKTLPDGIGKYMQTKISERAGNTEEMVFLRDKNDWAIFFAFLYSSRMDYLKFGKLVYDDWKSDSCISNYLKEVLLKSVSSKKRKFKDYKRYSAFFWTGNESLKFKHLALRGHGGQLMIINLDTGAVLSIHSIRKDYDISKVEKIVLEKLIKFQGPGCASTNF